MNKKPVRNAGKFLFKKMVKKEINNHMFVKIAAIDGL
jgi:hypothetical protein